MYEFPLNHTVLSDEYEAPIDHPKNNSSGLLIPVSAMLGVFSIIGTFGNGLVLCVFGKRKEKLTSTIFIISLAGTDLVTCVIIIPFTIVYENVRYNVKYDILCKMYNFLITSSVPCSAFIMVAIAVDRYFCICRPFMRAITPLRAKVCIVFLGLFAMSLGAITAVCYGVYQHVPIPYDKAMGIISGMPHNMSAFVYSGLCKTNTQYISAASRNTYQVFHASLYLISVLIVSIIYLVIYRHVRLRRAARLNQNLNSSTLSATYDTPKEETQLTIVNGNTGNNGNGSTEHIGERGLLQATGAHLNHSQIELSNAQKSKKEKARIANMKTAAMLFVVTLVFILAFLPAWLMAHDILPINPIVFYMYFSYNVANPIVYAFMNKFFRDDLRALFSCFGWHSPQQSSIRKV